MEPLVRSIQGIPSGPGAKARDPEWRLQWVLKINQHIKYFSFILPRNLLQSLLHAARKRLKNQIISALPTAGH